MIDIKGIRFLYTKYTIDLIYEHLIKNMDFTKLSRKAEIMEDSNSKEKDFFNYEKSGLKRKESKISSKDSINESHLGQKNPIDFKNLKKVALIGIRIEDP
jgi:hypothetical protein